MTNSKVQEVVLSFEIVFKSQLNGMTLPYFPIIINICDLNTKKMRKKIPLAKIDLNLIYKVYLR